MYHQSVIIKCCELAIHILTILCYYADMDVKSLTATGLTKPQAEAYALLIELGEVKPAVAATKLKITRTNAYKVLDKLVELGLATKQEEGKTLAYTAANPIALASLTANFRAEATAREEAVNRVMQELFEKYQSHSDKPAVSVVTGRKAVAAAYRKQINLDENIRFLHTPSDLPLMGFETMHDIRTSPGQRGRKRRGILPIDSGPINYAQHKQGALEVTVARSQDYNAPVEWSVTESSLLIVLYATEPHAILIVDKVVAGAFLQVWALLNRLLQEQPHHQNLKAA
jgi:predicted transcriptional regulator